MDDAETVAHAPQQHGFERALIDGLAGLIGAGNAIGAQNPVPFAAAAGAAAFERPFGLRRIIHVERPVLEGVSLDRRIDQPVFIDDEFARQQRQNAGGVADRERLVEAIDRPGRGARILRRGDADGENSGREAKGACAQAANGARPAATGRICVAARASRLRPSR